MLPVGWPRRVPRWLPEIALLVVLYAGYDLTRALARAHEGVAVANGRGILRWEWAWHLSPERALNLLTDRSTPLAVVFSYWYASLHFLITPAVLVWLYRRHSAWYRTARTAIAAGTVIGLIGFFLFPTAPPRLVPGSGIGDTLVATSAFGWWRAAGSVPPAFAALSNQYAAMPSLHVGWALWCGVLVAALARRRWVRWLGALYPLGTAVVVLATGNHYLLDVLAGVLAMGIGWLLVSPVLSLLDAARRLSRSGRSPVVATPVDVSTPMTGATSPSAAALE